MIIVQAGFWHTYLSVYVLPHSEVDCEIGTIGDPYLERGGNAIFQRGGGKTYFSSGVGT
jgi:hypothetical protein